MKLKFCGIRREKDIVFCNRLAPDYMGMILTPGFRRSVPHELARKLLEKKLSTIFSVGVFVDESADEIAQAMKNVPVDIIQLHGNESAQTVADTKRLTGREVWKAVHVQSADDIRRADTLGADKLLLDAHAPGQSGSVSTIAQYLAAYRPELPFFLAGGLTPDNVSAAIRYARPYGVDTSGGIETDGAKDFEKMKHFSEIVRGEIS